MGTARNQLRAALELLPPASAPPAGEPALLLVACSGGPDSLALAAAAAFFGRQRRDGTRAFRVGAVIVDHGLQDDSDAVAERTRSQLERLGLAPVQVRRVQVRDPGMGPEA
ncbi:tRNA(Ile)-lysidine synthetase, partial [Arthrobacter sp. GCM10027362]